MVPHRLSHDHEPIDHDRGARGKVSPVLQSDETVAPGRSLAPANEANLVLGEVGNTSPVPATSLQGPIAFIATFSERVEGPTRVEVRLGGLGIYP